MFLFRRWNGMSAPPSPEDAKSPPRSAGIRPPWSTGSKRLSPSTSLLKTSVYQQESRCERKERPSLTYLDHQLSRVDGGVLRLSSSQRKSVAPLVQNHFLLENISSSGALRQTTSSSTLAPFVSPSLLSSHSAPADDHVNNTQIHTCAVDGNQSKRQLSRLHTQSHYPPQDHSPPSTPSSLGRVNLPDPAYRLPCHSHRDETSLALFEHSEAAAGTKPPSDHLGGCKLSEGPKDLLEFRLWPLPTDIDHIQKSPSVSHSTGALISGANFDVRPDTMSSNRDFVSSESSQRSSGRPLYDNPADALRQITGRRLASSSAFSCESASTISRNSEPVSPTGRLRRLRSNPFQFADDLNPALPRYAPSSVYVNEQSQDYAVMNSWNDSIDSIYDKYDEEGPPNPPNTGRAKSEDDDDAINAGALDIELEPINRASVLSSPIYMTASFDAVDLDSAEAYTGPQTLQESEVLQPQPTTPRLEREDSTIFETPSPPPALTQAAQTTGHIGHALSTIFEVSSPPDTTSRMDLAVVPQGMETPTPPERPTIRLPPGPTATADYPSNGVPRGLQSALHDNAYCSKNPDTDINESSSIQTPSTGILFPKESSRFQEQLGHDDLIGAPATDQACTGRSLASEEPDLVEPNGSYRNDLSTNIPDKSIPKQWNGGSISRKRPSPTRDDSSLHKSSKSSSESWEDITMGPNIVSPVHSPAKPVQSIYEPQSFFIEADGSNEYLPTPAGSLYEFTPSPAPRLSQELEQLAASMSGLKELERFRTSSPTNTAYCPPHSPPVTPGAQITSQDQEVLDVIGSETMLRAEVFEDGPQRNSYDSFTTVELEEMANPSVIVGKKNRLSKMMDPIWRIGSGTQRTQEVVETKKAELEKKRKLPRSVVLHGNDSRKLMKAPAAMANQSTDGRKYTQHKGPSAQYLFSSQNPYRLRSDSRSITPELDVFGASPAPYSPLPEPYQNHTSSVKLVGHNAHKMSYLSTASIINSNLQRSSDFTRHSAVMDGRYPSPNVRRSYIENKKNDFPGRPVPAYVPSKVTRPVEMDPEDIEMQTRKPLKACVAKEGRAPSHISATLSEHDRNMLESSKSWHEFRDTNPSKLYYPVGDRIYHCGSDGSRDRLVAARQPALEVPPGDGSHEQKKGEQFVWFALGCLSVIPFFIPLFIVGVFNETFCRMTNNRWAAPNKRHIYVAIRILFAWALVILAAIIATIIGLARAASFH